MSTNNKESGTSSRLSQETRTRIEPYRTVNGSIDKAINWLIDEVEKNMQE